MIIEFKKINGDWGLFFISYIKLYLINKYNILIIIKIIKIKWIISIL